MRQHLKQWLGQSIVVVFCHSIRWNIWFSSRNPRVSRLNYWPLSVSVWGVSPGSWTLWPTGSARLSRPCSDRTWRKLPSSRRSAGPWTGPPGWSCCVPLGGQVSGLSPAYGSLQSSKKKFHTFLRGLGGVRGNFHIFYFMLLEWPNSSRNAKKRFSP